MPRIKIPKPKIGTVMTNDDGGQWLVIETEVHYIDSEIEVGVRLRYIGQAEPASATPSQTPERLVEPATPLLTDR